MVHLKVWIIRIVSVASFKSPVLSIGVSDSIAQIIEGSSAFDFITIGSTGTDAGFTCAVGSTPWIFLAILVPTGIIMRIPTQTRLHASFIGLILAARIKLAKAS
jgi:uncharacterized protein (DUF983 family)